MKRFIFATAASAAALVSASQASAAVVFTFAPGVAAPTTGFNVVSNFNNNTLSGFTTSTPALVQVKSGTNADAAGAPPAFANGDTPYLSVLGGGNATYTFATPISAFQFDWGSVDSYNSVVINYAGGSQTVTGTQAVAVANGNQTSPITNGLFTVTGTAGEQFTSITLLSDSNSFEVDNLAIAAVPESATWALMLLGFGMVGVGLRSRRQTQVTFG